MKSPLLLILVAVGLTQAAMAQEEEDFPALSRSLYRSGQQVLNAFAPVSQRTRDSVVEVNVNEDTVALGAVVDTDGLVLTKASELKSGKLTCWLASGKEVEAKLLALDDDDDVALLRVQAKDLKPIQWATGKVVEGQWAITPGLADTPQAVGIISTLPHRIQPQRAYIGVVFRNDNGSIPIVEMLMPGYGAEDAGVKPGDIVVAVDGSPVTNRAQVLTLLGEFRDGQKVQMRFRRNEQEFDASIKLTTPKPGQAAYDSYANEQESSFSGDVSQRSQGFDEAIEHDTILEPWQCGGPLVNLEGKAIGLNIARATRVATYALPASLAQQILVRLKSKAENSQRDDR